MTLPAPGLEPTRLEFCKLATTVKFGRCAAVTNTAVSYLEWFTGGEQNGTVTWNHQFKECA